MLNYYINFPSVSEYIFVDLHAEQAYGSIDMQSSSDKFERGIHARTLTQSVINNIYISLQTDISLMNSKVVIVDFKHLEAIQPNLSETFVKIIKLILTVTNRIFLVNIDDDIMTDVSKLIKGIKEQCSSTMPQLITQDNRIIYALYDVGRGESLPKNWTTIKEMLFNQMLESYLGSVTKDLEDELTSSPVYANKYIDIKRLIENTKLCNYSIYLLGIKIKNKFLKENNSIKLFCQSLNSSYIAIILSRLLCIDLVFIDHLGPIANLYKMKSATFIPNNEYIIVSDVICLGTETKRVESVIQINGGTCIGNACIVQCKSTKRIQENNCALLTITEQYNPLNYFIYTDFCNVCERGAKRAKASNSSSV